MPRLPQLTGSQLRKLLKKDGWYEVRPCNHGVSMAKEFPEEGRTRVTVVPTKRGPIRRGTLGAILGYRQTNLGREGLLELIDTHGI